MREKMGDWQELAHGTYYRQDVGALIITDYLGQGDTEFIARHPKGPVKNHRRSGNPRFDTLNQAMKAINDQHPPLRTTPLKTLLKAQENPDPQTMRIVGLLREKPELLCNVLAELQQVKVAGPWRRPDAEYRERFPRAVVTRCDPDRKVHTVFRWSQPEPACSIRVQGSPRSRPQENTFPGNTVTTGMKAVDKLLQERGYILLGDIPEHVAGPWVVNHKKWTRRRDGLSELLASITETGKTIHWEITLYGTLCDESLAGTADNVSEAKNLIDTELRSLGWIVGLA